MRARSALFTLFGDAVRPAGGEAWLATLTTCMGALGFTPEATRTALHRMAAEGWVTQRRVGRYAAYRLTDRGVERLEQAAARIYRLRAVQWDGRWRLLVAPEAARIEPLARELRWLGFGRLSAETWVSPHRPGARMDEVFAARAAAAARHTFVTAPHAAPNLDDRRVVDAAWDFAELRAAHEAFLERWSAAAMPSDDEAAFRQRIELVHHWRSFLFLDPGLPVELLPDNWRGHDAAACFRQRYEAVSVAAWRYYDAATSTGPEGAAPVEPLAERVPSPFFHSLPDLDPASSA